MVKMISVYYVFYTPIRKFFKLTYILHYKFPFSYCLSPHPP